MRASLTPSPVVLALLLAAGVSCAPGPSPLPDGGPADGGDGLEGCELPSRVADEHVVPRGCDLTVADGVVVAGGGLLVLEPGVTLRFGAGAGLEVEGGTLEAIGEEGAKIRLLGLGAEAGAWPGLIVRSNQPRNRLEHVEVRFGGENAFAGAAAAANVYLDAGARLSLVDCELSDGAGYGLVAEENARLPRFARNTFASSAEGPVALPTALLGSLDDESDYGGPYLTARAAEVSSAQTWPATNVPVRLFGLSTVTGALVVAAGAVIEADAEAGLDVSAGSLLAAGEPDAPVVFRGAEATPGFWRGLIFRSSDEANRLVHTEVRHAGGARFTGTDDEANVYVGASGRLEVEALTLSDSAAWGLYVDDGGLLAPAAADDELTFANNAGGDLRQP